jgi:hypothetical protein
MSFEFGPYNHAGQHTTACPVSWPLLQTFKAESRNFVCEEGQSFFDYRPQAVAAAQAPEIKTEETDDHSAQQASFPAWTHCPDDNSSSDDWEDLVSSFSPGSSSDYCPPSSDYCPPSSDYYLTSSDYCPSPSDNCPSVGSPSRSSEPRTAASTSTKWQRKKAYERTLPLPEQKKRRLAANARERKRMTGLNSAFERLREILPAGSGNSRPMSKMDALQMAQVYIRELSSLLE